MVVAIIVGCTTTRGTSIWHVVPEEKAMCAPGDHHPPGGNKNDNQPKSLRREGNRDM